MTFRRFLLLFVGSILVIFGFLCANYIKPSGLEHHQEWAAENNAPPPSDSIVFGSLVCVGAGVGILTLGLLRGRGPK